MGNRSFIVRAGRASGWVLATLAALSGVREMRGASPVPDDFPTFSAPGQEQVLAPLREMFWLHYEPAGPLIPLWDEWMPNATLWPARGEGPALGAMRRRWAEALASRTMNDEGYIHTRQHDGPAHAEGWPFPFWSQAGGVGWHFAPIGVAGYDAPLTSPDGWKLAGATGGPVDGRGWSIAFSAPEATIESPPFSIAAAQSPWVRINWHADELAGATCTLEWTTAEHPEFAPERSVVCLGDDVAASPPVAGETRTMILVYRSPGWQGQITGFRLSFRNAGPANVVIKSMHTASDTRHNINNLNFIRGCHDYFAWSQDVDFLRGQIGRIRTAMRFVEREFQTRTRKCIYTTWPGHEGRSGVRRVDGVKVIVPGEGVGSNYWDLLPFGGEDALATIYYYDALLDLAALEEAAAAHPEWSIDAADKYDAADLRRHAQQVRDYAGRRFWNADTGRFGTRDLDGALHDYGFTFLNNEAVYHGLATPEQARSICDWISGARTVAGDTSVGPDIYHWRFGPRSTTLRNLDYYVWTWSNPEGIPWGYQVQDGGAVLGWSYHDLMARLMTAGPDDAAARLKVIGDWFRETQQEGGYRAYYEKDPSRGTLQGANVAGGLGLDKEFFESVLVPQVMLYGFLGFRPTAEGCAIDPHLPTSWPELTISRIHLHGHVLTVTAKRDGSVVLKSDSPTEQPLVVECGAGVSATSAGGLKLLTNRRSPP